jgi:hypothetical protein
MPEPTAHTPPTSYEPPRIERVLSPEDLEREILYAGITADFALSLPV